MRVIVQRVSYASVKIDGNVYNEIANGLLLFVGYTHDDTEEMNVKLAQKIAKLRIFEDENGKMNLGIEEIRGSILSISQFTLYADCRKGRRPGFDRAARAEHANRLYEHFNQQLEANGLRVKTGVFQADMKIELLNDGPVTLILDSAEM